MKFKDKKVLIMGLGLIGKGLKDALFFSEQGAKVTVTDLKTTEELKESVQILKQYPQIKLHLGGHQKEDFQDNDMIIRNPAVPEDSPFLQIARKHHHDVFLEEALTAILTPAKIIGITGTRGKTTVATLVYQILKAAGQDAYLAGNVRGTASLPLLDQLTPNSYLVLELSSWQLQGFRDQQLSPHYAVITNIYPDHLNRYDSMADYVQDKKAIYQFQSAQDQVFLNQDFVQDPYYGEFIQEVGKRAIYFSRKQAGNYSTKLLGEHNQENIAAALSLTRYLGVAEDILTRVISDFSPIEFRLEKIRESKGITFINDAASTTPIAGIKALASFSPKVLLIAGGASKNLPLEEWAEKITQHCQKVALLAGEDTERLEKLISQKKRDLIVGTYDNLAIAVQALYSIAQPGDIILLSPGSASFGLFVNEFDRGQQFNQIVKKLK